MKCREAKRLLTVLDNAISDISHFQNISSKQENYLAAYLVVLASGVFEESIEQILIQWASRLRNNESREFINKNIPNMFRNPNSKNINALFKKFGAKWNLNSITNSEATALDSINSNKTDLAHKGSLTITLLDTTDYINRARKVIEKIDKLVLG